MKIKENIIMNVKKIGLSALAGSLAMVSANAVELAVSGKTELTYVSMDTVSGGNPWGMGNAITFAGSGDVNGMTATYTAVIGDGGQANSNTSETFASSSLMLDMGDLGTVGFDQGVGEFGASTIDDKMPYAYEEIWTYVGGTTSLRAAGGSNVLGYKNSFAGYTLSVEIDPGHSASATSTKGGTGDGGSTGTDSDQSGYNFALTGSPMDGVSIGFGHGSEEDAGKVAEEHDASYDTLFATYAIGGATVGYQMSQGRGGSVGAVATDTTLYGASFAVNENLAMSYNIMSTDFLNIGNAGNVEEKTRGMGASYTMGSAAVRVLMSDINNKGGDLTANDLKHTEISLMLAF